MKSTRPLTGDELSLLQAEDQTDAAKLQWLHNMLMTSIGLVLLASVIIWFTVPGVEMWILLLTVGVCIGIILWSIIPPVAERKKNMMERALFREKNEVGLIIVQAERFIYFPEYEDEGDGYLFQLANNKVLAMGGQEHYMDETWPTNDFEIAIGYNDSGRIVFYNMHSTGQRIEPAYIIEGMGAWFNANDPNLPDPEAFTIADGILEDYLKVLNIQKTHF